MGASKDLFLKFTEEEYMQVPERERQMYLNSKIYSESPNDFNELMTDPTYAKLYAESKKIKKQLNERQYQLRENRRKP